LAIRLGKRGRFIGCTGYPDCDYTQDLSTTPGEPVANQVVEGRQCPDCHRELHIKTGRYGRFIGCSSYPECKFMEPIEKPEDTGVDCPKCNEAHILKRKSRKGKIFYSCARYPSCDYAIWNEPVAQPCPECAWPILTIKETKRAGKQIICPRPGCSHLISDKLNNA